MSDQTKGGTAYLYIYRNDELRKLYVGIGGEMTRVWQQHNQAAEDLRNAPGTQIFQTVLPFSTWDDARKAEAIAIHIASLSGLPVAFDPEDVGDLLSEELETAGYGLTNHSGARNTSVLGPVIWYRPGEVLYGSLTNCMIVPVRPDQIDNRPALHGGLPTARFAERAQQWWPLAKASEMRYPVNRLIAVLKGRHIIVGSWAIDESRPFVYDDVEGLWRVNLIDPEVDNVEDFKGKRLRFDTNIRLNSRQIYSDDVRVEAGLK